MALSRTSTRKMAGKLTRPVRATCKPIRSACKQACTRMCALFKAMGKPSYEYKQAATPSGLTNGQTSMLPYGMQTAEEAEERDIFTTAGTSSSSSASSPSRRSRASTVPSTSLAAVNEQALAEANDGDSTDSANGSEKRLWVAATVNIHRFDDLAELVPSAGPKRNIQRWLSCPSKAASPPVHSRATMTGPGSSSSSAPQAPTGPRICLHSASDDEDVFLAPSEMGAGTRITMHRQDGRFLTSSKFVGDHDQWEPQKRRSRSPSRRASVRRG